MKSLLFLLLGTAMVNTFAAPLEPSIDGEYTKPLRNCFASASTPGGWDCGASLEEGIAIKKRSGSTYYLFAKTRGVNAHFCEYEAIARWQENKLIAGKRGYCEVTVTFKGNLAFLSSEGDGCRDFCGARASLGASDLKKKNGLTRRSTGAARKAAQPG